jgi:signal transduction histidine kinase
VYIARDITVHRRAEQLRNDVERVVRHDLKSPLNGIIGGSKMMLQDDNLTGPQINMLKAIYESGLSVLSMVDKSLNLYRMEEGIYELKREVFDLRDVLLQTRDRILLGSPNPDVGLRIIVNGEVFDDEAAGARGSESTESHESTGAAKAPEAANPPAPGVKVPPIMISAERRGIETILSNIILNAIEAAPQQTEVTVAVESVPGQVKFDIHNYGVIPMEVRDRFFERYVTSGKEHGTGLGTYSVYLITQAHGGQVSFTSDETEGTHLLVEIPFPV